MEQATLKVEGMHCPSCAMLIGEALEEVSVESQIDSKTGQATVKFDSNKISLQKIKEIIQKEGYKVA